MRKILLLSGVCGGVALVVALIFKLGFSDESAKSALTEEVTISHKESLPTDEQLQASQKGRSEKAEVRELSDLEKRIAEAQAHDLPRLLEEMLNKVPAQDIANTDLYRQLFARWATIEPGQALDVALARLPENSVRLDSCMEALEVWTASSQSAPRAYMDGLMEGYGKEHLLYSYAKMTAVSDPEGTLEWASALASRHSPTAVKDATLIWLEKDPAAAIAASKKLAGQSLRAGYDTFFHETALYLARSDSQALVKWVDELPAGRAKVEAIVGATDWLTENQPEKTSEWLLKFKASGELDPVYARFATRAASIDPEGAITWAETITDPVLRKETIHKVLEEWSIINPAAAGSWKSTHP
jgi:hypothetical protein